MINFQFRETNDLRKELYYHFFQTLPPPSIQNILPFANLNFTFTQVLLSLVSLAASAPVIVQDHHQHFQPQLHGGFHPLERSDQESLATSSGSYGGGGDYGGAGGEYGGGYGGGDFGHEAEFGGGHGGGFEGSSGGHLEVGGEHSDYSSLGGGGGGHLEGGDEGGVSLDGGHHSVVQSVPVSEHVEVTKPVPVKVVKHIGEPFNAIPFLRSNKLWLFFN